MKTTEQKIVIMQAYLDGKTIQYRDIDEWIDLVRTDEPIWNWLCLDYRVKPEQKVVPYESAEEFLAAQKEHGLYIRDTINGPTFNMPLLVTDELGDLNFVYFDFGNESISPIKYTFKSLLESKTTLCDGKIVGRFTWQDGHVCGKEVDV